MVEQNFYRQIEAIKESLPPVDSWDPPLSGNMDCVIRRDGSWYLDGGKLENNRLVRLFSTVLKREGENYFLVTPAEKWRIEVEDLPFTLVELEIEDMGTDEQLIRARTNVGDWITIDKEHALEASPIRGIAEEQAIPFVYVRSNLAARFNRNTYLELADLLEPVNGTNRYRLTSAGTEFTLEI